MKRLSLLALPLVIVGFQTDPHIQQQFEQEYTRRGYTVVSPGGIAQCFASSCAMRQMYVKDGVQYTQLYTATSAGANQLSLTSSGDPQSFGVIRINGERIGFNPTHSPNFSNSSTAGNYGLGTDTNLGGDAGSNTGQGLGDDSGSGSTSGDVATAIAGRVLFAVFSSYATLGTIPNNAAIVDARIRELQAQIKDVELSSAEMTRLTGQMIARGVEIPQGLKNSILNKASKASGQGHSSKRGLLELSSLSAVSEYRFEKGALDQLAKTLSSGDLREIAKKAEQIVSANAQGGGYKSTVQKYLNESGVVVPQKVNPALPPGPLDNYKLRTSPDSISGRLIRRAAIKNQLAWAKKLSEGVSVAQSDPALYGSTALIRIADERMASRVGDEAFKQAEGFAYVSEKISEAALGFGEGAYEELANMADAIMSIPQVGNKLYDFGKEAIQDPAGAGQQMWDTLAQTPEFASGVYHHILSDAKNFGSWSVRQQWKFIGKISADVLVTKGVGKAFVAASGAFRAGEAVIGAAGEVELLTDSAQMAEKFTTTLGERAENVATSISKDAQEAAKWTPKLGTKYADAWGEIEPQYADEFDGPISKVTLEPGTYLTRVEYTGTPNPGRWFGDAVVPGSPQEANELYNIANFHEGKLPDSLSVYRVTEQVAARTGKVANGVGKQIFINHNIPIADVLKEVPGAKWGF